MSSYKELFKIPEKLAKSRKFILENNLVSSYIPREQMLQMVLNPVNVDGLRWDSPKSRRESLWSCRPKFSGPQIPCNKAMYEFITEDVSLEDTRFFYRVFSNGSDSPLEYGPCGYEKEVVIDSQWFYISMDIMNSSNGFHIFLRISNQSMLREKEMRLHMSSEELSKINHTYVLQNFALKKEVVFHDDVLRVISEFIGS